MADETSKSPEPELPIDGAAAADPNNGAPPDTTSFEPAEPLKDAGVAFEPAMDEASKPSGATQLLKDGAAKLTQEATDRARAYAEDGKGRAGEMLDELSRLINDAAGTVDEKLGEQFGVYARNAATTVNSFSEQIKAKDLDELVEDARGFVRKSPAVAVGTAAALGFVLMRLIRSGVDSAAAPDASTKA